MNALTLWGNRIWKIITLAFGALSGLGAVTLVSLSTRERDTYLMTMAIGLLICCYALLSQSDKISWKAKE